MRFASLGSGSRGNSLVVDAGDTKLLVDCGFSLRATRSRLARLSLEPEEITGILVTHEHGDHMAGVYRLASRFRIPVYLTHGTHVAVSASGVSFPVCEVVDGHAQFRIGSLSITPFPVPHDAREPIQYVFSDGESRLGILTDCGTITPHVVDVLSDCHALVLECNHDRMMLANSDYPAVLKRRISGDWGHLSNTQSSSLLRQVNSRQLKHVVAAHLSEQNNCPALAAKALAEALGCDEKWIGVASQEEGIGWRDM
jgi:Metal-dependent hydrolases of the beta-lactamase superfamily I